MEPQTEHAEIIGSLKRRAKAKHKHAYDRKWKISRTHLWSLNHHALGQLLLLLKHCTDLLDVILQWKRTNKSKSAQSVSADVPEAQQEGF